MTVTTMAGTSAIWPLDQFAYLTGPTTYTVTSSADTDTDAGGVTLRYAIEEAVANRRSPRSRSLHRWPIRRLI